MKVLVLACLVAVACAAPNDLLGSIKCTWGPSYWCQNYKQAVECQAIEHCKAHVWKSNDMCADCKSVVEEVNSFVKNNGTEILNMMNDLCDMLGTYSVECKAIVEIYGQTILKTIVELTADSQTFCTELGLCSKKREEVQRKMMKVFIRQLTSNARIKHLKSVKTDYCNDCKLVFAEIKDLLEDKDLQGDIVVLAEKICAELPSVADTCKSLVDQFLPVVLAELDTLIDPPTLCAELGLCNSTKKVIQATQLKPSKALGSDLFLPLAPAQVRIVDTVALGKAVKHITPEAGPECILCEFIMDKLEQILKDNATEAEIKAALDKVCSLLPSTLSSECDAFVNEYADMIIKLLLQEFSPGKICTQLGLCSGTKKPIKVSLKKPVKVNEDVCGQCKLLIGIVKSEAGSPPSEAKIRAALASICNFAPPAEKQQCKDFVSKNADTIVKLILAGKSAEEICTAVGACTGAKKPILVSLKRAVKVNEDICGECKMMIGIVKMEAGSPPTEAKIRAALANICNFAPAAEKQQCKDFVSKNADTFVKLILAGKSAEEICTAVGACTGAKKPILVLLKKNVKSNETCVLCKTVIGYLQQILESNATEEEIKKALEEVCNLLPGALKTECDALIEEYGDLIIKFIAGELSPEELCKALGLCTASQNNYNKSKCFLGASYWCANLRNALKCQCPKENQGSTSIDKVKNEDIALLCKMKTFSKILGIPEGSLGEGNTTKACNTCISAVKYLGNLFPKNVTKKQLIAAMNLYCTRFIPEAEKYCKELVKKYGDLLADILLGKIDPKTFCEKLGFCKPPSENSWNKMKCYLGESYWCASYQNAVHCQALEHCKMMP